MVTYRFGPFSVKDNESLWRGDTLVPLSPLQLRLLCFLCSHPQQVLDKERIVLAVWGHGDVSDVSLARAVHGLRSRLAAADRPSELIRNIYGRGYMLTQPVRVSDATPSLPTASEQGNGHPPTVVDGVSILGDVSRSGPSVRAAANRCSSAPSASLERGVLAVGR